MQTFTPPMPKHQPLFPTMDSVQEVMDFAESKLPITDKNDLIALLGTHSNTLLKLLSQR
jgi:hypothetical protein